MRDSTVLLATPDPGFALRGVLTEPKDAATTCVPPRFSLGGVAGEVASAREVLAGADCGVRLKDDGEDLLVVGEWLMLGRETETGNIRLTHGRFFSLSTYALVDNASLCHTATISD